MIVFLTGFMGSGKSTTGRRLAAALEYDFYDLDALISRGEQMPVEKLFETRGETAFRQLEKRYLYQLLEQDRIIVSMGGGTPCIPGVMNKILKSGVVVYLHMSVPDLHARLLSSKTPRPLIQGMGSEELKYFIRQKLKEREGFYQRAHIIVDGAHTDLRLLREAIVSSGRLR